MTGWAKSTDKYYWNSVIKNNFKVITFNKTWLYPTPLFSSVFRIISVNLWRCALWNSFWHSQYLRLRDSTIACLLRIRVLIIGSCAITYIWSLLGWVSSRFISVQLSDTMCTSWSVIVILFGPSWYECHHLRCTNRSTCHHLPLVLVTPSLTFHPCSKYHHLNFTLGLCLHWHSSPTSPHAIMFGPCWSQWHHFNTCWYECHTFRRCGFESGLLGPCSSACYHLRLVVLGYSTITYVCSQLVRVPSLAFRPVHASPKATKYGLRCSKSTMHIANWPLRPPN